MTAATEERRHAPLTQYFIAVAVSLTVAILQGISSTAADTLDEIRKMSAVVYSMNRDIERHEAAIGSQAAAIAELQAEFKREAGRVY